MKTSFPTVLRSVVSGWLAMSSRALATPRFVWGVVSSRSRRVFATLKTGKKESVIRNDAARIAAEVFEAFRDVASKQPGVIKRFREVFEMRGGVPELNESRGDQALAVVLTDLFWGPPPDIYFNAKEHSWGESTTKMDSLFEQQFQSALTSIATESPYVLRSMQEYRERYTRSFGELLTALFAFYIDNGKVYPF